jgi:hypothetical protein
MTAGTFRSVTTMSTTAGGWTVGVLIYDMRPMTASIDSSLLPNDVPLAPVGRTV